jgi:hypothetical protein
MIDDEINPYQAPAADTRFEPRPAFLESNEETVKFVRRFRRQIHILGGLWVVVGVFMAIPLMSDVGIRYGSMPLRTVGAAVAGVWFAIAALTVAKQLWAVALGVGFFTFTAVLAVAAAISWGGAYWGLPLWLAIFLPAAPVQGVQVLRLAGELRRAGIPWTLKPDEVFEFLALPHAVSEDEASEKDI